MRKRRRLKRNSERCCDLFCEAASVASKNGAEFADYVRLLALCGVREQETIKLWWADVDFEHKLLTIVAEADTKNREARRVDFNAELETHLKIMRARRAPDSQWLFPSPQRGERDEHAKTFRESLLLARAASGWICQDCEKATFWQGESPKPAHNARARDWRPRNRDCRSTCNGSASTIAGTTSSVTQ